MPEREFDFDQVDAIHVYRTGEAQHVASMDCVCEPRSWVHIEHPDRGGRPLDIVVHGDGIEVLPAMKDKKLPDA